MQQTNKLTYTLIIMITAVVLITGCNQNDKLIPTTKNGLTQKVSTRLKWLPGATYIGSIVAKEAGYFKTQGLEVEIFPGGFEADPIKLVAAGSNDFGITGAEQLLQARANGVPIVAIFMELRYSPAGWMTLKSSAITKPQDFIGKKVGAQYGTNIEPTLDALLAKLNINPKDLTRIPVKYDISPLFSGQVDVLPVYLNGQPVQARLEGKAINTIDPSDYGIRLYGNVCFTRETMIREHPELVQRFVNALTKGWNFAVTNPDEAVSFLIKAVPKSNKNLELAVLKATIPFVKGGSNDPIGKMSTAQWEETRDFMINYSGLSSATDIEVAYTNEFVNKAQQTVK
ncbi:MAG: hypothetical protein COA36_12800 [Desulfotalea sp.]|nr:MAG: hypothetical protein COA36_12800 [Desulfotalea sp.]